MVVRTANHLGIFTRSSVAMARNKLPFMLRLRFLLTTALFMVVLVQSWRFFSKYLSHPQATTSKIGLISEVRVVRVIEVRFAIHWFLRLIIRPKLKYFQAKSLN